MSVLLYSALDAPMVRHLMLTAEVLAIAGAGMVWASWRNSLFMQWFEEAEPRLLFIPGVLIFAVGAGIWVSNVTETYLCRSDLREGKVTEVRGLLTIDPESKLRKGDLIFAIDRARFATGKLGQCDCGFIQAMGNRLLPAENHQVRALVRDGVVLQLERRPQASASYFPARAGLPIGWICMKPPTVS